MTTTRTFADVRAAGEAGALAVSPWIRIRGCLDFAPLVYASPLEAIAADPVAFDARWTGIAQDSVSAVFQSPHQCEAWTVNVLMALEAAAGVAAPSTRAREDGKDDWRRLQDLALTHASLNQRDRLSCLAVQARALGVGLGEVTRDWACVAQDRLDPPRRLVLRAGIIALDTLHEIPAIAASGLLPAPIGALPKAPSPNAATPLPGALDKAIEDWIALHQAEIGVFAPRDIRFAAGWFWRRVVGLGLIDACDDPDLTALAQQPLVDAVWSAPSMACAKTGGRAVTDYMRRMVKILQAANPALRDPRG